MEESSQHDTTTIQSTSRNLLRTTSHKGKRGVPLQLLHARLGHRSTGALLTGELNNIWNDVQVIKEPDTFGGDCHVTLSRKKARNPQLNNDVKPGQMVFLDIQKNPFQHWLTSKSHFKYFLLAVDTASRFPVLIGLNVITSTSVIKALQYYRAEYVPAELHNNLDFASNTLTHVRADAGNQFVSQEFRDDCNSAGIRLSLAAPHHQEMNGIVERTWQSIRNIAFAFMNHARVSDHFGDMALEHAWKIFALLPIKDLVSDEGRSSTPFEKFYNKKPSLRRLRVLFCPCVYKVYIQKSPKNSNSSGKQKIFDSKNNPQRGVYGIYCGIPRGQAGYLIYQPRTQQIIVSQDVSFDEEFLSMGPRMHKAFTDAIPVQTPDTILINMSKFKNSVPHDDHYGTPQNTYFEETPTDGWYRTSSQANPSHELFDKDEDKNTSSIIDNLPTLPNTPNYHDEDDLKSLNNDSYPVSLSPTPLSEEEESDSEESLEKLEPTPSVGKDKTSDTTQEESLSTPSDPAEIYVDPVANLTPRRSRRTK
jgi:hypothetical protein